METLTHFQQAVLFFQCCIGSTVSFVGLRCIGEESQRATLQTGVSLITIIIRRHYFGKRFAQMVRDDPRVRKRVRDIEEEEAKKHRLHNMLHPFAYKGQTLSEDKKHSPNGAASRSPAYSAHGTPNASRSGTPQPLPKQKKRKRDKLRVDMIRRTDTPVRVNQMNVGGFLAEEHTSPKHRQSLDLHGQSRAQPSHEDTMLDRTATRTDSPVQMSFEGKDDEAPRSPRQRRVSIDPTLPTPDRTAIVLTQPTPRSSIPAASVAAESSSGDSASSDEESSSDSAHRKTVLRQHNRRTSDPIAPSSLPKRSREKDMKRFLTHDPPKSVTTATQSGIPRTQTIGIREPTVPERELRKTPTVALPHVGSNQPEGLRRRAGSGISGFGGSVERSKQDTPTCIMRKSSYTSYCSNFSPHERIRRGTTRSYDDPDNRRDGFRLWWLSEPCEGRCKCGIEAHSEYRSNWLHGTWSHDYAAECSFEQRSVRHFRRSYQSC